MRTIKEIIRVAGPALVVTLLAVSAFMALCASASAQLHGLAISHYGAKVNATTEGNFCTLLSGESCQAGERSVTAGGFGEFAPKGIAVAPNGDIYIADTGNNRVQELSQTGEFLLMFGEEVNETKVNAIEEKGGSATLKEREEANVCTQVEVETIHVKCKAGVAGSEADELTSPESIAIDPVTGNIYVAEQFGVNNRVDEYTSVGQFVLMIGMDVNETTGGNLCAQTEVEAGTKCQASNKGEFFNALFSNEHGALFIRGGWGNEIAAGGPKDLLYAGSVHHLQEFEADGTWVGEVSLEGISAEFGALPKGIAIDQTSGNLYLTYPLEFSLPANTIYAFNAGGSESGRFPVGPRETGAGLNIEGLALDESGHLALSEEELGQTSKWFGSLLDATNGTRISEFPVLPATNGSPNNYVPALAFNTAGELYGTSRERHEVVGYVIKEGAELITKPAACKQTVVQHESLITNECALAGEVNPSNISETETWFQIGTSATLTGPGTTETAKQAVVTSNTLKPTSALVEDLRPNQTYYYRVAASDQNFKPPTPALTTENLSITFPMVPPVIIGAPSTSFIGSSSVVMSGELDPENANTTYAFEYGACEHLIGCSTTVRTGTLESNEYGKVGATLEARNLQPGVTYRYRLVATNGANEPGKPTQGPEGTFTTSPSPAPQVETGPASSVTATSAVISGTVSSAGQTAAYTFQLGVYDGASTRYGIVLSASTDTDIAPVAKTLQLMGLQPGTTYAYKITIKDGYGEAEGAPATFMTAGLPSILTPPSPLVQLPVPKIQFPHKSSVKHKACKRGYKRDKGGRCVKVKKRRVKIRKARKK
jgi:hypothetical protein